MRYLSILFLLLILGGVASAQWYPSNMPVVQTTAVSENSDDDQIAIAHINEFNSTTHFLLKSSGAGSSWFLAQPDSCRNIIGTMNTSTTGSLKLTGTDNSGATITENLTWAGETGIKASTRAFLTVTRVDGTCTTNTAQFKLGTGNLLGLRQRFPATTVVIGTSVNGVLETVAPAMTYSTTVLGLNTVDTSSVPGGYVTKVCLLSF